MIFDTHTHIGRNHHISSSVDDLLRSMDKAGVAKSLVFAGELNDAPIDWVIKQVSPHKDRLYVVADYVHDKNRVYSWGQENYLADLYATKKIVAVKFYTGYDHFYPSDVGSILYALEQEGCPAIFHSGDCLNSVKCAKLKYSHPLHIDEVAVQFSKMNFIIAHMGNPYIVDTAAVCYKNDNVYTDISGFVYGDFTDRDTRVFSKILTQYIDIVGDTKKLMFGSDFPISNQVSYIKTMYGFPLDGMENIMSETAKKVFKLA